MITGFIFGSAAAFVWSLTNIVDKHLVNKHAADGNVWSILILSSLFPAALLPIANQFIDTDTTLLQASLLLLSGMLMIAWIYFYLKALTNADTSVVMTILILAPVFGLVFGHFLIGEVITLMQVGAGVLMILGAMVVSYELQDDNTVSFPTTLLFYALTASVIMGLMHALFKFSSLDGDFWNSVYWRSLGMVITGLILCLFNLQIINSFLNLILSYSRSTVGLNTVNESLSLLGDTLFSFAILLAPIALIQTTESLQPLFIIIITFILSTLGVKSVSETYSTKIISIRIFGIILTIIGSALLVFTN